MVVVSAVIMPLETAYVTVGIAMAASNVTANSTAVASTSTDAWK